jgi:transcriptional regulator with XRE-family HTH domain
LTTFSSVSRFSDLVQQLIADRYGTAQALADALGMSLSAFQRGVKNGSLGVENLLRLSVVAGVPPGEVLRAAGKGPVLDLIETLFGPAKAPLTGPQRELLELWPRLPSDAQRATLTLVRGLAARGSG